MNNWLDKLERKFSRYAIPNLMTYIIILYAAGFVLNLINPTFYSQFLSLDAGKILQGQIWRIVTFIIQPPSDSLIFIVFVLYLYYMIGKQLEAAWGAFRFNLYFFSGMLFIVIGAILAYLLTGAVLPMDTWYLNLSLFFAFAALYPDIQLLLFFVIPIKIKWLAMLDGLYFVYAIVQAFLPAYGGGVYGIYCTCCVHLDPELYHLFLKFTEYEAIFTGPDEEKERFQAQDETGRKTGECLCKWSKTQMCSLRKNRTG